MIERIFDYRKIKQMVSWKPVISSDVFYLIDDNSGIWGFVPSEEYDNCMEVHVDMNPKCRGKEAVEKCKAVVQWMFNNTDITRIIGEIPCHNRRACFNAVHSGLKFTHEDKVECLRLYEVRK